MKRISYSHKLWKAILDRRWVPKLIALTKSWLVFITELISILWKVFLNNYSSI